MPTDSKPAQHQIAEAALQNFILLTLPWLTFRLQTLEIAKRCIQNAGNGPTESFARSELHALMMIVDRSRAWRNLFGQDFENRVENVYKNFLPKLVSASVQLIEAQEKTLTGISDALKTLRKDGKANSTSNARD